MIPAPHLADKNAQGSLAGRLALQLYHKPIGKFKAALAMGPGNYLAERLGEAAMRRQAPHLPVDSRPPLNNLETPVVFMTGEKYWHETMFCAHSLMKALPESIPLRFVSDGSLSEVRVAQLRHIFPHSVIFTSEEVEKQVEHRFPVDRYPLIRFYRLQKPIIRKLTDVFILSDSAQLLLDSDMLFFRRPNEIEDWLTQPEGLLAMRDCIQAYGYSPELMRSLVHTEIPDKVNIGVFGLRGSELNWDEIENWIKVLTETEGLKYNLCQGLSALLFARSPHRILNETEYEIRPSRSQTIDPKSVMQHYVAESKQWYFRYGWRRFSRRDY